MSDRLAWGVLGTGNIARQFCAGVPASARGRLVAVGSRRLDSARAFAEQHQVPSVYGSYDQVLADPAVQAVYVSLPNSMHHEWTIQALRAGKHVLCEKPIAVNAGQARAMFTAAQAARRVLVEAFMYRCHPQTLAVLDKVRSGAIGEVRLIRTSFCFRTTKVAGNIRFSTDLAGGCLMDVGCYCVSFCRLFAGAEPDALHATARLHESGVDEITAGTMHFPNGVLASFACGMSVQADNTAYICGSEGFIEVPVPWKPPVTGAAFTVARSTPPRMDLAGKPVPAPPARQTFHVDAGVDLYGLEADAFAAAVLDGRPPHVPAEESIGNMVVLDALRRQIGLAF